MSHTPTIRKLVLTGIGTADSSLVMPANSYIEKILIQNTTSNAITGGLKFGTTAGGVDVVAALTVGSLAVLAITDAAILKAYFVTSQQLFIDAVVAWNSATVNITIVYGMI